MTVPAITTKPGHDHGPSIKNPRVYEALRNKRGMSKRQAARISNAKKAAAPDAGAPLSGPGGLLGTPGMGTRPRKWGNRKRLKGCTCGVNVATKEQIAPGITRIRGNLCNVHGRYGPCDAGASGKKPKAGKGKKGRKPAKAKLTPEQRAAARDQEHAANRTQVLSGLGIAPDGQAALDALRSGRQADPGALARGGFAQAGLVEQAQDGSYRLTASGRAMLSAASSGDAGRAGDTISSARDRASARTQRQSAAAQRKQDVAKRRAEAAAQRAAKKPKAGGGGSRTSSSASSSAATREQERQQSRQQRQQEHAQDRAQRQREHAEDRARRLQEHEQDRAARQQRPQTTRAAPAQRAQPVARSSGAPLVYGNQRAHRRTKAQSDEDKAMFAKMGGGGKGGSGGGGGGGSKLWPKGPSGKRVKPDGESSPKGSPAPAAITEASARASTEYHRGSDRIVPEGLAPYRLNELKRQADSNIKSAGDMAERATERYRQRHAEGAPQKTLDGIENDVRRHRTDQQVWKDIKDGHFDDRVKKTKSFTVFKSADGSLRWIARTTTAYRDRDGEIITMKALEADAARMTATGQYGPLRYWHIGEPDPFNVAAPWGPGLDIGDCDYSIVIGRTSIESGTFKSSEIGQAFAESADEYETSPGFFHPPDQPNAAGEFESIRRFERSPVPIAYGRASNLFTGMTVKEFHMDQATYDARVKAFMEDMNKKGVPPQTVAATLATMQQADKSAEQQGIAYKSDDAPPADPWQAVVAALKAALVPATKAPMDAEDDPALGGDSGIDEAAEGEPPLDAGDGGDYIGDMSVGDFRALLSEILAPVLKMQEMHKAIGDMHGELKGMLGGYATKDAGRASEIATLKAQLDAITAKLTQLTGDQPAVGLPAEVEAALKSGGPQAPPDPSQPQIPAGASPLTQLAARTMPQLYQVTPNGQFNGWVPPQTPPPQPS